MKSDKVIVRGSNIEGKGVFASYNFKKGEVVLRWDISQILSKEAVDKMSDKEKKYISLLNNKHVVMQEPERYVNHSCDANTIVKNFCDIAIKDISIGEEVTSDYSKAGLPLDTYMKCNCKSKNCKKVIKS